jgi:L-aspartate oxidase
MTMFQRYLIDPCLSQKKYDYCDCIVIGSGIAGLSTAIRISEHACVKVITKSSLSESTTWYAQGGIAAVIKKPDEWKSHYEDTIIAGQGLSDSDAVLKLVKTAPKMIEDLFELGIIFDISGGEISLTTEGGHSFPRVLHAGGDATGEEIEKKLVKYSKTFSKIKFFPEYLAVDILTNKNKVLGVLALNISKNALEIHPTGNVVIASGGIGNLFELTTNPSIATGDGIAMAYRAGASIKDIEFMQFHPTVFKTNDGKLFLITEALRGEGAYLRDKNGNRFMVGAHPKAELAPRDIVVKEMVKVMKAQGIANVSLDATHIPESFLKLRFPNIVAKLRENGLNLHTDLIKVFPAAHYLNGGIKTDLKGNTDIKGLYACGECAATGAHGANRLASNSLIEGLVFGWEISKEVIAKAGKRSGADIENTLKQLEKIIAENSKSKTTSTANDLPSSFSKTTAATPASKGSSDYSAGTVVTGSAGSSGDLSGFGPKSESVDKVKFIESLMDSFRHMMSHNVGIHRDTESLLEAQDFIEQTLKNNDFYNLANIRAVELLNMLTVGSIIIKAAMLRKESRGTHQRNDYPLTDDKNWKKHIVLKEDEVKFEPVK